MMRELTETEAARVALWRKYAEQMEAKQADNPCYIPSAIIEELEGKPRAEVLTAYLVRERLTGNEPITHYHASIDTQYEASGKRQAENNARDLVQAAWFALFECLQYRDLVPQGELSAFMRKFYRAGDCGLRPACERAIACAMGK